MKVINRCRGDSSKKDECQCPAELTNGNPSVLESHRSVSKTEELEGPAQLKTETEGIECGVGASYRVAVF